jgi:hypothetical protein
MSRAGVKKTLQNEHGGYLIDDGTPIGRHAAGGIQVTMGFGGGEPFVPQRHLHTCVEVERVGEILRLERLRTDVAGHVERIAHHHPVTSILAYQPGQRAEILAPVLTHQGKDGLGGEPQLVGNGDPDPAITHVKT